MIAFGPIPSRRLGHSLGVNHIPPKTCSYSCVYCQVGRTDKMRIERRSFYEPDEVVEAVEAKVKALRAAGKPIDYITFVPDGEPTLDINLGWEIERLKPLGIDIAVITNSSLVWREDVRDDLARADWVSLNVDAADETVWQRVDRPHGRLALDAIREGMVDFAQAYTGTLTTETMLVQGVNDDAPSVRGVAEVLARLAPDRAYLAIPTRPPAERWVRAPDEAAINRAYQILSEAVGQVEYLIGYEGNAFATTGDAAADLLSITAVHPMRRAQVNALLARAGAAWSLVQGLIERGDLVETVHEGERFYMRAL